MDDEQKVHFAIEVNTTSADISPHKNSVNLTAKVVRKAELELRGSTEPDQVFYGGEIVGESSMRYEEDIGSLVVHTYVVTNRGPWKARRVEVAVEWPYEVENGRAHGKWLLYLLETQVQGSGYCDTEDYVNPLKLRVSTDFMVRINFLGLSVNESVSFLSINLSHDIISLSFLFPCQRNMQLTN